MPNNYKSERAWIDVFSNFAMFDGVNAYKLLESMKGNDFPADNLLTILHELTHHWCLNSPVGRAIGSMQLYSYCILMELRRNGEMTDNSTELFRDLTQRISLFIELFRPAMEGLATFAEWRLAPVDGVTFSSPFNIIYRLTPSPELSPDERQFIDGLYDRHLLSEASDLASIIGNAPELKDYYQRIIWQKRHLLQIARLQPDELRRRAALFQNKLSDTQSPYQLGYLFMCAITQTFPNDANLDQALAFMRDYLFLDFQMASDMLNLEISSYESYSLVSNRLRERLALPFANQEHFHKLFFEWRQSVPDIFSKEHALDTKDTDYIFLTDINNLQHYQSLSASSNKFFSQLESICETILRIENPVDSLIFKSKFIMPLCVQNLQYLGIKDGKYAFNDGEFDVFLQEDIEHLLLEPGQKLKLGFFVDAINSSTVIILEASDGRRAVLGRSSEPDRYKESVHDRSAGIFQLHEISESYKEMTFDLGIVDEVEGVINCTAEIRQLTDLNSVQHNIVEIYRFPTVVVFGGDNSVFDAAARAETWAKFGVRGVSDLCADDALFFDFVRCSALLDFWLTQSGASEGDASYALLDSYAMKHLGLSGEAVNTILGTFNSKISQMTGLRLENQLPRVSGDPIHMSLI